MNVKIEMPPMLTGSGDAQLRQVYSYLYRLSETLNVALNSTNQTNTTAATSKLVTAPAEDNKTGKTYNELRALIVNTAEIIRVEMDSINQNLSGKYEAISSDWGNFTESFETSVTTTAQSVLSEYDYDARLEALDKQAAGFEEYRVNTEGFIRQGFISYDDEGAPVIGIAIGQELSGVAVEINGETVEQFDTTQNMAFYTADGVSFYIGGAEVAYVSNQKLYIREADITTGVVSLGGKWQLTTSNGFAIKWIGSDT